MRTPITIPLSLLLAATGILFAQVTPPDAGQVLINTNTPAPKPPNPSNLKIPSSPVESKKSASSGIKVEVLTVVFDGNTLYSTEKLRDLLNSQLDQEHNLEGLSQLARTVTEFYHKNGYPFARAFVPEQDLTGGVLRIQILEATYGLVVASGDEKLAAGAQPYLSRLKKGDLIHDKLLERTLLILDDVPGLSADPLILPGKVLGAGDIAVAVNLDPKQGGSLGFDNEGSRYTGEYRFRAAWFSNSALMFGDNLAVSAMTTNASLWLGSIDYDMALGGSGLRSQLGWALNTYELGKDFAALQASGLSRVYTAKLSYPFLRTRDTNLYASFGLVYKSLHDDYDVSGASENKFSQSLPLSLRFDHRDSFGGGGVSYGALTWTRGNMNLDAGLTRADDITTRKQGVFNKLNLDVARIQNLPAGLSFYGRYSLQLTDRNLDSSERLGLGGPQGVRAYPLGEGTGDKGWLAQTEVRYNAGAFTPYAFFDIAWSDINYRSWNALSDVNRSISGAGIGLRTTYRQWSGDVSAAWEVNGGDANSDSKPVGARIWFSLSRSF